VQSVLEKAVTVKAVISEHQHWNKMHMHHGIPYFTVTSLVENFHNDGITSEVYTMVNLNQKKITLDVRGNDPALFEYTFH